MNEAVWLTSGDPVPMLERLQAPLMMHFGDQCFHQSDRKLRLFACACVRQLWDVLTDAPSRQAVVLAERFADEEVPYHAVAALTGQVATIARSLHPGDAIHGATLVVRLAQLHNSAILPAYAALLRELVGNPYQPPALRWENGRLCEVSYAHHGMQPTPTAYLDPVTWLTPTVRAIALAAYTEQRPPCQLCGGSGFIPVPWTLAELDQERRQRHPNLRHIIEPGPAERSLPCWKCTGHNDSGTLDPVRLAVLADALEDAGCTNGLVLRHLREGDRYWVCSCGKLLDNSHDHNWCGPPIAVVVPHYRGCHVLDWLLGKT